jgi:hypothetical protein
MTAMNEVNRDAKSGRTDDGADAANPSVVPATSPSPRRRKEAA